MPLKKSALRAMIVLAAVSRCACSSRHHPHPDHAEGPLSHPRETASLSRSIDLTGKIVFPEEEEISLTVPKGPA